MTLSPQHRAFLLNEQILGPAIINFVFNAGDAWYMFRDFAPIPMWTLPGVALDLLGLLPGLPFLITLITTPIVRRALRKQKLAPLARAPAAYPVLRWLPAHNFWRATALGIATLLVVGPLLCLGLWALGTDRMDLVPFVLFKSVLAAVLAAIVSPIAAFYVLAEAADPARRVSVAPAEAHAPLAVEGA